MKFFIDAYSIAHLPCRTEYLILIHTFDLSLQGFNQSSSKFSILEFFRFYY